MTLQGLRVVEVSRDTSVVGAGMAARLPGALLRDFGASVSSWHEGTSTLDAGVEYARVWDRGKHALESIEQVHACLREADVLLLCGPEPRIEGDGFGYDTLSRINPRLVHVRIRPSVTSLGAQPDLELLVAARAGLLTQLRGHRAGPVFSDLAIAQAGAAMSATAGALARLYDREATGRGGWVETSLQDGLQAMLPMILGRAEHDSTHTRLLWKNQGPPAGLAYACADGAYLQLWFGVPGAYEAFLARMGDAPSERGYAADLASGALVERGERWARTFATRERAHWLRELDGAKFRCEPILRPGEALFDPQASRVRHDAIEVLGPVATVTARDGVHVTPKHALLRDVKVLDLSAYLAGPIGTMVLAELGAQVLKVEPLAGDAHRGIEPMFAAGQRGKRTIALDLKAPGVDEVLARLYRASDVVHHNSRVGLAEKLGYDEARVRAANPGAVYSFASGFGESGPRALLPANDHLMQALCGIEAAQGGHGQPPTVLMWGALDVTGGWLSACGMLAALYARRRTGHGQRVASSLFGAALLLKSGAFVREGAVVEGPRLDEAQTGYGAVYRIYECEDGWLALAVRDRATWARLRSAMELEALPHEAPPLRTDGAKQPEEALLEARFRTRTVAHWLAILPAVERVRELDRAAFASGFLDDPVGHQLGRVTHYTWGARGRIDQTTLPPRCGPHPSRAGAFMPELGEHTHEVLAELGLDAKA